MDSTSSPAEKKSTDAALDVRISGRVQGVGYRYFAKESAQALQLAGWVRNASDGSVEGSAQGPREVLEQWLSTLKKGPALSDVQSVLVTWKTASDLPDRFFSIK